MTIPIYRHNQDNDDWEVASVYDSDDCDSMGRSACDESVHSSVFLDNPALHMQGNAYDGARPLVRYSVPQQQPQNYAPVALTRPRWETRHVPAKQSNFIVPPPGVIFPTKERALPPVPPQDAYWPSPPSQIASSDRHVDASLAEPPPPSLLLSPSSPPHTASPLIPPYATSVAASGTGTGTNVNTHASAMMPPPPRYHEPPHAISPRLTEAGCQARPGMGTSPRRSGHDVLSTPSSYTAGARHAPMADGRTGGGGASHAPGNRSDLQPVSSNAKHEYDREHGYGWCGAVAGRTRPEMRERRPSIWRRFVRRLSPHVSVGQT